MNPGGGPDRDDTGLPPVDVEIPDDARELDRDVQAYHRELRAERRRSRSLRLHGVLGRDGMVMPLLICCLVFALITGTLLTLFTSTPIDQGATAGLRPGVPGGHPRARAGQRPGERDRSRPRRQHARPGDPAGGALRLPVRPDYLAAGPPGCRAGETVYLVAAPGTRPGRLGAGLQSAGDVSGVLTGHSYPHVGLTAIAVNPSSGVSYQQRLQPGSDLQDLIGQA